MTRVGVVGLGIIGRRHLAALSARDDAQVIAIGDANADLLGSQIVTDQLREPGRVRRCNDVMKLIRDREVDLVVIALPTHLHARYASAAIRAGKHVLIEKPLARTSREGRRLAKLAGERELCAMVGFCMRFWPGWDWLKRAIDERQFGGVRSAQFYRLDDPPVGRGQYEVDLGGALFELHVHDVDFVQHCFGLPQRVSSVGYRGETGGIDHVLTRYEYDGVPLVTTEASSTMPRGYPLQMGYRVSFERATAVYDGWQSEPLTLYEPQKPPQTLILESTTGVERELDYLLDCIKLGKQPTRASMNDAALATRIIEFEKKSITADGRPVKVRGFGS